MAIFNFNKKSRRKRHWEEEVDVPNISSDDIDELNQEAYNEDFYAELDDIDELEDYDILTRSDADSHVEELYSSGMDLDEIEKIEYKRSARQARQAQYRAKVQDRADFLQALLTPNMIIGYLIIYVLSVLYLWYISGQLAFSILISLVGTVVIVYWYIYQENKLDIKQDELDELEAMARDITMQADIASNTYEVIGKVAEKYNRGRVGNDINMLYDYLQETGDMDTSRFSLYDFIPIEIFMRNLEIWYTEGADTRSIFTRALNDISFEIIKRDELRQNNRRAIVTEMATVILGALFPVIMRLAAAEPYSVFIGQPVSSTVIVTGLYFGLIMVLASLKKRALDINIR